MNNVSKHIFDSAEDINEFYGVNLKMPKFIPNGCNLLCYEIVGVRDIAFFHYYKIENNLYYYNKLDNIWIFSNTSLEQEVAEEIVSSGSRYIYLSIEQKVNHVDEKLKFTTERLLGVCVYGYNEYDYIVGFLKSGAVLLESGYVYNAERLSYYASDDSDEIVSLDEYIKLFYNSDNTL